MRHRIAACLIVGDLDTDQAQQNWKRVIQSLEPHVDGIFVHHNGKGTPQYIPSPTIGFEFLLHKFKWDDNFSLARTQNFEMVDKSKYNWYFWIDLDDELVNGNKLHELLDSLDSETQGVFLKYEYGVEPDTQEVLVEQWRERLLRTDGSWRWDYPIHEVCHAPPGTQYAYREQVVVKHHRTTGADDSHTRARNRRILVKARKLQPEEPRHVFYFANEVFAEGSSLKGQAAHELVNAAMKAYKDFLTMPGSGIEDSYMAANRIAECYRIMGDHSAAIDWELQALKILPDWPEAYLGIAESCLKLGDAWKCKQWCDFAINLKKRPQTATAIEPLNINFWPYVLRGNALEDLGQFKEALKDYRKAYRIYKLPNVKQKIKELSEVTTVEKETYGDVRKKLRNTSPDNSIAFVIPPSAEPWHPLIEKKGGIGGAETCVMEIAKRFAADGHRTVVFGTPGNCVGVHEGIEWWPVEDWNPTEKFHTLISSRSPEVFDSNINAEVKLLWMHDVNTGNDMEGPWGNRLDKVDKIIGLTNWHINHLSKLYNISLDKFSVVNNGINVARFATDSDNHIPRKFVYSSSPDRGLDVLLGLWPNIKNIYPEAELHVYYGWESINAIIDAYPNSLNSQNLSWFRDHIQGAVENLNSKYSGIFWHGRKPQDQLAKELSTCFAWLYPTYFMETFCITALETQMAGVIPVTSDLAALKETVAAKDLLIPGYPRNVSYQNMFLDTVKAVCEASLDELEYTREIGREHASQFTWEKSYSTWQDTISACQGKVLATA